MRASYQSFHWSPYSDQVAAVHQEGQVSRYDRKGFTAELGEALTDRGGSWDERKSGGVSRGLVFLSELIAPVFPGLVVALWVVEENGLGRHDDDR